MNNSKRPEAEVPAHLMLLGGEPLTEPRFIEWNFVSSSPERIAQAKAKRGVAIFAKAFLGIPAQQAAKITRPLMPSAAPAVLLHSLHTQQGVCNIVFAMTRRDFVKPAFSLRKQRFVKTHALSLLGTKNLRFALLRFQDFQRPCRDPLNDEPTFSYFILSAVRLVS